VILQPGRWLACTASSLVAQSVPWDHGYCTNGHAHR
jgi:hypothetical protein